MLRIRLTRVGKRGKPSYRIVVAESTAPRDGAYVEWIGNYDPMVDPPAVSLKRERAAEWLKQGARPSEAVSRILTREGILERAPGNCGLRLDSSPDAAETTDPVAISGEAAVGGAPDEAPEA